MSNSPSNSASPATLTSSHTSLPRPQRVLACVYCQKRKVKCDRKDPCANCVKSRVNCIPTAPVLHRRKRRYPERELLDRLRKYEELLRRNGIAFEPIHPDFNSGKESVSIEQGDSGDEGLRTTETDCATPSTPAEIERLHEAKNVWRRALSQEVGDGQSQFDSLDEEDDDDDARDMIITKAWDQVHGNDDHLLFGSPKTVVNLYTLHPEPAQIFLLWHIYLENVNPLLKVTHVPSLQGRIIEASTNIANISPPALEALMFSIYCMAILSLSQDECWTKFGSAQEELLARYQFGCRQALWSCGFLRCNDRDCLTAIFLYLVSLRSSTTPQALSSLLGVAIRIAQRMGIHDESALAKCNILEAEIRRRLWWALVLFDTRVGELSSSKTFVSLLTPSWDCRVPLNVNDSQLRIEMKTPPKVEGVSSEALFAVVRSKVGDFVRHTMFNLGSRGPASQGPLPQLSESVDLEKLIEDKYLKFCDPANPDHFMIIWMTRAYIAKCRLAEHNFGYSGSASTQIGAPLDEAREHAATAYALRMLECDTRIMISPLVRGFLWLAKSYFPFTAYVQIVQHLKWQYDSDQAQEAWETMSDNYHARFDFVHAEASIFEIFIRIILQAWEVREKKCKESGQPLIVPRIVLSIRHKLAQMTPNTQSLHTGTSYDAAAFGIPDLSIPMPMTFDSGGVSYNIGGPESYQLSNQGMSSDMYGVPQLNDDINQLGWPAMD